MQQRMSQLQHKRAGGLPQHRCPFVLTPSSSPVNLLLQGSVAKITGKEGLQFRGPARVFDGEEDMIAVVNDDPQKLKVSSRRRTTRGYELELDMSTRLGSRALLQGQPTA